MGNAASYAEARVKLHQAEYSSDLTDTENISRKKRPSAKILQSQLSTQLQSSENSDSSEELPPTPPNQLLWPAVREVSNYFQNPTAQRGTSPTATITSPTARGVASSPATVTSPTARGVSRPAARGVASSPATVTSSTARGVASSPATVTSPTARGVSSPTARGVASPTCEAMFTKILTVLEEVKETQRVHGKMLNALLKKQDGSMVEVPEGVVLPLKTQADLEALDQKLGDRSVMSAVVAMVADVGGTSIDDATRRMMKYVFSNELALEYNLFGRHGKKKFKDLRIFNVVYEALKNNPLTSKVNQQEAERALSKWFTGARDRGGQRASRMHQKMAAV
ncbi:uncharacterized protein LOC113082825 [Carassius auratus]|uniref:Uncharacterized protein LOC113082825 n=1 Tax=Carassius auratus TaxID=7957 RepID=A0A6P6NN82_CARAU|nr:uncharacterized protein LOC113082825 [Carassius auratus]